MALIWADSFETYGVDTTGSNSSISQMQRAGYVAGSTGGSGAIVSCRALHPRTGARSLAFPESTMSTGFTSNNRRRIYRPGIPQVGGVGVFVYVELLNWTTRLDGWGAMPGLGFFDDTDYVFRIILNDDGSLSLGIGAGVNASEGPCYGTIVETTAPGLFVPYSMTHLEVMYDVSDPADASIEVRVNNVPVITASGLNLGSNPLSRLGIGDVSSRTSNQSGLPGSTIPGIWFDDLIIYDTTGDDFNTWIGSRFQVFTCYPNADLSPAEWQASTGTDVYAMLAKTTQDSSTYAYAENNGDVGTFGLGVPGGVINAVKGVIVCTRAALSDVGSGDIRVGISAGGVTEYGSNHELLALDYTSFIDIYPKSPDGDAWTPADLSTLQIVLERTA